MASNFAQAAVLGHPCCFDVLFGVPPRDSTEPPLTPQDSISGHKPTMLRFNELLLECGVHKADLKYYISTTHTDEDIAFCIAAFRKAAQLLKAEGGA